ncbi:MAG: hypothetical protein K2F97_04225 [Muribaculaceae bacterium]|nr:hypothetical protein [Muribaculaceae bacterium]MDE6486831.1 hypothetical protein [Muribaculaceae bacterium]
MKKAFLYLLLLASLPVIGLTACSDDGDDLPDVNFSLDIAGGVSIDGVIYVVEGEDLVINSVSVTNNESDKSAIITAATYYWDAYRLGTSAVPPYGFTIHIAEGTAIGKHELAIECPVYAVDKSPAVANVFYTVQVVESADDIPDNATPTTTFEARSHILPY